MSWRPLPFVAGLTFAGLYLSLLTQQYIGDGMRWYGAMAGLRPLELGGTNHLLYPLVGRAWFAAWTALGAPAGYALAQAMNAVLGSVALGFFCAIVQAWTGRAWLAVAATATLGLSRAFSLHGVDMTEPMPGVACAMAGIWLASRHALRPGWRGWLILAGALLGLGAAIYQSNAVAVVGACALLALAGPPRGARTRIADAAIVGISAGGVAAALFLSALLALGGARTLGEAFVMSLETESARTGGAYAEISLRRLGVLAFGLADSLFGIRGLDGISADLFARGLTREVAVALAVTAGCLLVPGLIGLAWLRRSRSARGEIQTREGWTLAALAIWLVPQLGLAFYFGARYSKLWMLSLAVITLMVSILVAALQGRATRAPMGWRIGATLFVGGWVLPVAVVGIGANLIPDHNTPLVCLADAQAIARRLGPRDLLVSDWGGLPCAPDAPVPTFTIAGAAFDAKLDPAITTARLAAAVDATQRAGGAVYFYGLLDLSPAEWEPFFGQRLRLAPAVLDPYRARAAIVMPLGTMTPEGRAMNLWRIGP